MLNLSSITFNEFIAKDSFAFAKEIVHQDAKLFMGSFDVDSLFTNITVKETINANLLCNNVDVTEGINKFEFENLLKLHAYLHICHPNMFFHLSKKKNGNLSFLVVEVSRQQGKFVTTVYRKPTFSGVCTYFDSFFDKVGMIYILAY